MSNHEIEKANPPVNKLDSQGRIITGKRSTLADRISAARREEKSQASLPNELPNRIAILADCSGSMSGLSISQLKDAVTAFLDACNQHDTSVAVVPFPFDTPEIEGGRKTLYSYGKTNLVQPLSNNYDLIKITTQNYQAKGGTPMAEAMKSGIEDIPISRAILISDGQPDWEDNCIDYAKTLYKPAEIPIDCIHIGPSGQGEEVLKRIAEITGGMYIKFKDISRLVKSLKFLAPTYRAMLNAGTLQIEGADEVRKA